MLKALLVLFFISAVASVNDLKSANYADYSDYPMDRVNNLKLRAGIDNVFSFAGFKHRLTSYSREFYSFFKVKMLLISSDRSSRILAALGLSVVLIFLIFFIALQLQRAVILRAFEDSEKDAPRIPYAAAVAN